METSFSGGGYAVSLYFLGHQVSRKLRIKLPCHQVGNGAWLSMQPREVSCR